MKKAFGFTLIELMIATAIVAILAAVAFPSFQGQMRKSRRGTTQAFMADVAQREQARMLDVRSYVAIANNGAFDDPDKLRMTIPADVSKYYDVTVTCVIPGALGGCTAGTPPSFTIFAEAKDSQDYKNSEDLRLQSDGSKARGDMDGNVWDASKW